MNVTRINPLEDRRWSLLVQTHPQASVFHTPAWLESLRRTYRYEPVAYVLEDSGHLFAGIPFCSVSSVFTGSRLVSLPFSDHCQPLVADAAQFEMLLAAAERDATRQSLKYLEVRPLPAGLNMETIGALGPNNAVVVHKLDISRTEEQLLASFHSDCIRRKIGKADREHLHYEEGRSEKLLLQFYSMLLMTRRRHGLPPQPMKWFRNLMECFGENLKICLASKDGTAIASILTLSFNKTLVYKYGCSDPRYNSAAGSVFLLWQAIRRAKAAGLTEMDMGRSDYSTPGLITFKDRWGAAQIPVNYFRSGPRRRTATAPKSKMNAAAKRLLTIVPDSMFSALGGLLYRHVG
ncbi:MAG TPA: GNAT family N-acetyltransferase [Terriglobia bacterium]|jgi:CelD/BcsL family acetyltransferase involved in cellulose biosynthesis